MGVLENDKSRLLREGIPFEMKQMLDVIKLDVFDGMFYEEVDIQIDDDVMRGLADEAYKKLLPQLLSLLEQREHRGRLNIDGLGIELSAFCDRAQSPLELKICKYFKKEVMETVIFLYGKDLSTALSKRNYDILQTEALEEGTSILMDHPRMKGKDGP